MTDVEEKYRDKILENLKKVKHKIIVMSGKGGVGKSTVAANIASSLSTKEYDVGLLDVDIHGPSIPKMLGIENERISSSDSGFAPVSVSPHLKIISTAFLLSNKDSPVIWRGPLKANLIKQFLEDVNWGELDYLIIDLPPGTGDEPLSIAQMISNIDGAVIVTTPQDVAVLSVRKSINFAKALNIPIIGIIENMSWLVCPHCNREIKIFGLGRVNKIVSDFNIQLLGRVPLDLKIVESCDKGKPFVMQNLESSKHFEAIVSKIEDFMEG